MPRGCVVCLPLPSGVGVAYLVAKYMAACDWSPVGSHYIVYTIECSDWNSPTAVP